MFMIIIINRSRSIGITSTTSTTSKSCNTPNLPTKIVPTNIARVRLPRKIPRKFQWAWEFHPFKFRLHWSQALRNPRC